MDEKTGCVAANWRLKAAASITSSIVNERVLRDNSRTPFTNKLRSSRPTKPAEYGLLSSQVRHKMNAAALYDQVLLAPELRAF